MVEVISEGSHLVLGIRVSFADLLCLMGWQMRPLLFMVLLYQCSSGLRSGNFRPVPGLLLPEPTMSGICGLDGHVILLGRDGPFGNGVAMTGDIWPAITSC